MYHYFCFQKRIVMYNFSIIIPHKNIPNLLKRCLDSIPTRDDLQIIVIDDNSDSKIVNFKEFPGTDDKRVELIFDKTGRGAGHARNCGLNMAKGRWILFAVCDDFFSDKFDTFLDKYLSSESDVVYFPNDTVDCETLKPLNLDLKVQSLLPLCDKSKNYDPLRYLSHNPWCKMVKHNLIVDNNIRFQEVKASNDVWYSTMVGYYAKKIEVSEIHVYVRTVRQGSLQYSLNADSLLSRIHVGYKVNKFLKSIGKIEYYNETWGYFCNLRRISFWLFLKNMPSYIYNTPWIALKKNITDFFRK